MILNNFWKKKHKTESPTYEKSKTIRGAEISITDIMKQGKLDEITKQREARYLYGKRLAVDDLSQLDDFKTRVKIFNNLTNKPVKAEDEPPTDLNVKKNEKPVPKETTET